MLVNELQIMFTFYIGKQFILNNLMKNKVAIFGIVVQLAGLIYGIVNKAEDIIVLCLIFMFISAIALFDKKKK